MVGSKIHTCNIHICRAPGSSTGGGNYTQTFTDIHTYTTETHTGIYTDIHTVKYTAFSRHGRYPLGVNCLGSGEVDALKSKSAPSQW